MIIFFSYFRIFTPDNNAKTAKYIKTMKMRVHSSKREGERARERGKTNTKHGKVAYEAWQKKTIKLVTVLFFFVQRFSSYESSG